MVCCSVKASYTPCLYWSSLPSSQFPTFPALLHALQWPNVFYYLSSRDSYRFSRSAGSFNVSGIILKSGLFWIEENRYNFVFWHMYISFSRNHLLKMLFFSKIRCWYPCSKYCIFLAVSSLLGPSVCSLRLFVCFYGWYYFIFVNLDLWYNLRSVFWYHQHFFFFFSVFLWQLSLLCPHVNISFKFCEHSHLSFDPDCVEFVDCSQ